MLKAVTLALGSGNLRQGSAYGEGQGKRSIGRLMVAWASRKLGCASASQPNHIEPENRPLRTRHGPHAIWEHSCKRVTTGPGGAAKKQKKREKKSK